MKKRSLMVLVISLVTVFIMGRAIAMEKATKEECMAKCKQAADMVKEKGLDETLAVLMDKNGPFVWKDTYVFCIDIEKQANIAHPIKPKLIGKNLMHVKDVNGTMFFAEFVNLAKGEGSGWVKYMWPKLGEKKPSPKATYVYKVPGESVFMAAGIYE